MISNVIIIKKNRDAKRFKYRKKNVINPNHALAENYVISPPKSQEPHTRRQQRRSPRRRPCSLSSPLQWPPPPPLFFNPSSLPSHSLVGCSPPPPSPADAPPRSSSVARIGRLETLPRTSPACGGGGAEAMLVPPMSPPLQPTPIPSPRMKVPRRTSCPCRLLPLAGASSGLSSPVTRFGWPSRSPL